GLSTAIENYVRKRIVEGKVLERLNGWEGIHWAFAQPKTLSSLMNLKTLFLHSMEIGRSETPWFTPGKPLAARERTPLGERLRELAPRLSLPRKPRLAFQAKPK
ncbi:MAG: hypothetical protein V1717_02860, partial [Candidatus Micrarchaeota archaeon]